MSQNLFPETEHEIKEQSQQLLAWLESQFSLPFLVSISRTACPDEALSEKERALLVSFQSEKRKHQWRVGRQALKPLLSSLGMSLDSTELQYPHPRMSLTHGGDLGIAIAVQQSPKSENITGIGIDYEPMRNLSERAMKFYLQAKESKWIQTGPANTKESELIRLWSVKEALVKSGASLKDPVSNSLRYLHFEIEKPDQFSGLAHCIASPNDQYQFTSLAFEDGYLGIAIRY